MLVMPNLASLLKGEIARVVRKEVRHGTIDLKKAGGLYRREIAALKRRIRALEKQLGAFSARRSNIEAASDDDRAGKHRFSAKGLASQRRRLGLSAHDLGLLLGASGKSVYGWEAGKSRPRPKHLAAIAALKSLGKRTALTHLERLR